MTKSSTNKYTITSDRTSLGERGTRVTLDWDNNVRVLVETGHLTPIGEPVETKETPPETEETR